MNLTLKEIKRLSPILGVRAVEWQLSIHMSLSWCKRPKKIQSNSFITVEAMKILLKLKKNKIPLSVKLHYSKMALKLMMGILTITTIHKTKNLWSNLTKETSLRGSKKNIQLEAYQFLFQTIQQKYILHHLLHHILLFQAKAYLWVVQVILQANLEKRKGIWKTLFFNLIVKKK